MSARDATSLAHQLHTKRQYRHLHVKLRAGESCLALASPSPRSAPCRPSRSGAFLNEMPAWRKPDEAAKGGMENDMSAML